jgi:regulator of protease activity HflC (stomatin/prohibitin superfamily)
MWLLMLIAAVWVFCSIRKIQPTERGLLVRSGRRTTKVVGPGVVFVPALLYRLDRVSIQSFSVSLPPQSAITKDEVPIQLQAAFQAEVQDAVAAVGRVRDWRVHLMSELQQLMKDGIEELDFDNIDISFGPWLEKLRGQLNEKAGHIGVEITALNVSNLYPRVRPSAD